MDDFLQENKDLLNISDFQTYLFNTGEGFMSYEFLGVHKLKLNGKSGWRFALWAPNAKSVNVCGDWNDWQINGYPLEKIGTTGIWCGFFTDINALSHYKYVIEAKDGELYWKADPYAFMCELRPGTASVVYDFEKFNWSDKCWILEREKKDHLHSPMNIYEVHAGSWRVHDDGSFYSYQELADELVPYVVDMGYTHIELMPLTEFPFDGSWGYQVTGYFAATSRYGTPEQLKYFIDKCHSANISVIMDWVPAHFPRDAHGLRMFDGTPLYEYGDSRLGEHKSWGTLVFDYSKGEVISFLLSSAYFWAHEYHIDGIRVDAVSSMLYRDYSRNDGEWIANKYGGNGNLEAVDFLRKLNKILCTEFPGFLMIAEESTAWPLVTAPPEDNGLGFNFKWNMGWMNDTLRYMSMDSYFRKDNHSLLTFAMMYAFSENFILPLSHDEVVHGKHSLIDKQFGTYEDKFSSYRAFLGYYMSMCGKKLMFMGGEIGQFLEWKYDDEIEWHLLEMDKHKTLKRYVKDLNLLYKNNAPFWENDTSWDGFKWINSNDNENSVLTYIRKSKNTDEDIIIIVNFTPISRPIYEFGVEKAGIYEVILHSNSTKYGGNRLINNMKFQTRENSVNEMDYSLSVPIDGNSIMMLHIKKDNKTTK